MAGGLDVVKILVSGLCWCRDLVSRLCWSHDCWSQGCLGLMTVDLCCFLDALVCAVVCTLFGRKRISKMFFFVMKTIHKFDKFISTICNIKALMSKHTLYTD